MSRDKSSQDPSLIRREPADQSRSSSLLPEASYLSSLFATEHAPGYQQGTFPASLPVLASNRPRPTLQNASHSGNSPQIPLLPENSATSLYSSTCPPGSILDPDTSLSESAQPTSDEITRGNPLTANQTHGREVEFHPGSMSVAAGGYLAGPMQPNSHHYAWDTRHYQPMHLAPGSMTSQYPIPQPYHPSVIPVGYNGNIGTTSGPMPGYHDPQAPHSYLSGAPGNARQNQSRSPHALMARPFSPPSANPMPQQPLMASPPPYMMSPTGYYLPETSPVPSSHRTSMSSHSSPMLTEPVFASSEPLPPATELDHQVRLVNPRPRPQCWEHGCNGREFSTFSNLLRHQREKSGVVAKAECPVCGAVFTRTTARNIHVAQGKCKGPGQDPSAG